MSLGSASNFFFGAASAASGGAEGIVKSVRFNSADSAYLDRTPTSNGDQRTATWSFWVKPAGIGLENSVFGFGANAADDGVIGFTSGDVFEVFFRKSNAKQIHYKTDRLFRDPSSWYHIVVNVDTTNATACRIYVNGVENTDWETTPSNPTLNDTLIINNTSYVNYIGRFRTDRSADLNTYLADVYFVDGQALEPTNFGSFDANNVWRPKLYSGSYGTNGYHLFDFANESTIGHDSSGNENDWTANNFDSNTSIISFNLDPTSTPFTDKGGVYTITNTGSTTTTTAATNSFNLTTVPTFNGANYWLSSTTSITLGSTYTVDYYWYAESSQVSNATIVDVGGEAAFRDYGSAGSRTLRLKNDAGSDDYSYSTSANTWYHVRITNSGIWVNGSSVSSSPRNIGGRSGILYIGTYNNSGSYPWNGEIGPVRISYQNLGAPPSGGLVAESDGTLANVTSANPDADILTDVPTNGTQDDTGVGGELSANYCTWNPLTIRNGGATALQCVDGNLNFGDQGNSSSYGCCIGSIGVSSGKWYFEITYGSGSGVDNNCYCGILPLEQFVTNSGSNAFSLNTAALSIRGDAAYKGDGSTTASYATGLAIGSTLGFAFDVDAGTMTCFLDGVSLGSFPYALESGYTWVPFANDWSNSQPVSEFIINTGQRPWVATPPTDYKAICTANLTEATIPDGSDNFETKTFTGTGATQTISGLEFQPDLTLFAIRDNARSRLLFDSHRGATFYLQTNGASGNPGQVEDSTTLTSFNSDGFTVGSSADVNRNTSPIVAWNWKAGSSSPNTDGTISSTVRANTSAGFSIVTWTGTGSAGTVGHGLGAAPEFIIAKVYDSGYADNWPVYHSAYGATKYTYFNRDIAATTFSDFWNDTEPTSSVFSVGSYNSDNNKNLIAYCFAPVAGYSSFGTYESRANADNQFVFTGFKPRFVLWKAYAGTSTLGTGNWAIYDSARQTYNPQGPIIIPNTTDIETTVAAVDFLSNGFKVRTGLGGTRDMLYAAFAENPFSGNGGIAG